MNHWMFRACPECGALVSTSRIFCSYACSVGHLTRERRKRMPPKMPATRAESPGQATYKFTEDYRKVGGKREKV